VIRYNYAIVGVAIANLISQTTVFLLLMGFTYMQEDLRDAWILPDRRVFVKVGAYV